MAHFYIKNITTVIHDSTVELRYLPKQKSQYLIIKYLLD